MANSDNGLCLLCKIYPKSSSKEKRVLELLGETNPYYRTEKSKCTTWCYLTRSTRKGALGQPKEQSSSTPPMVVGVELYTHKDALTIQLEDKKYFQRYQTVAEKEDLYANPESLVAWYPTTGFVCRGSTTVEHEDGMMVILAEITCKDEKARNAVLEALGKCADWVRDNEPETICYSAMTRPKAPNEILVFERYRNIKSMIGHMRSKEVQKWLSQIGPHSTAVSITEWAEVEKSFVGPHPNSGNAGGPKL